MSDAEVRTFLLGAVVGLLVMGLLWALASWRRRRKATPPVVIKQIQLPIANPTPVSQADPSTDVPIRTGIGTDIRHDAGSQSESSRTTGAVVARVPSVPGNIDPVEKARYHRQLVSLSLELERVEQENTKLKGQWRSSQHQLLQAETGLDQARSEIADIRGIVLQLGATRADEDVIDLR